MTDMRHAAVCLFVVLLLGSSYARAADTELRLSGGRRCGIAARRCEITRLDTLPYVESDYTKRFHFDAYDNPKLKELRERYQLDEVVAPGKDEFERQVLLLDWVNHRFKKFGKPTSAARRALDILEANDAGQHVLLLALRRRVRLRRGEPWDGSTGRWRLRRPDQFGSGSTEHSSTEIWSNQYRKWVMLDPTFAMYVEKEDRACR